jgi:hypothetical protein
VRCTVDGPIRVNDEYVKALDCGDTDLVYLVLLHCLRAYREEPTRIFAILQNKPVAIKVGN